MEPQKGKLHKYSKRLVAFEHDSGEPPTHLLLWVGGLGDGLLTVPYPSMLAQKLPPHWALVEVMLLSTLNGFGVSSLQQDVKELKECVKYFRNLMGENGKIVLMGHSTGCQDAMEYVTGPGKDSRLPLDGVILQAPVSDREAIGDSLGESHKKIVETAQAFVQDGRSDDVLPLALGKSLFGKAPISAYRWLSLLSPKKDGDDDYFSSDLTHERLKNTFGSFPKRTPLLILCSGADEHVPSHIDVSALIQKWTDIVETGGGVVDSENGGIVPGAFHNLMRNDEQVVNDLCQRVGKFLSGVVSHPVASAAQL
jgi:pimeloyl-ACP methyl ester carboxylesterase